MQSALDEVGWITDTELVCQLERLVKADRALSAKLLVHLGEVEVRQLHCARGYSSMFEYCRRALRMSEAEAHLRILAARVCRQFPLVVERLAAGEVHLTGIKLLAPLLTQDNHVHLLDRVRGMTKRQIEVLVADLAPKPDVPARIRKLPEPRGLFESNTAASVAKHCVTPPTAALASSVLPLGAPDLPVAADSSPTAVQPSAAQPAVSAPSSTLTLQSPRARATSKPLGRGRFKLQVTLGQEAQGALEQLVELFRHQNPSGDFAAIVERALVELLKVKMKQRFGQSKTSRPQVEPEPAPVMSGETTMAESRDREAKSKCDMSAHNSRYIPVSVRRAVYARDDGQCTYEGRDGQRCTERGFLEIHHHKTTFARGGEATVDNLRLTCRAHNLFLAEQDYGRAFMQHKLFEAKERTSKSRSPGTTAEQF